MSNILNQIDLSKIFDPNLIFEASPDPQGFYLYIAIIYGLILVLAIILGVISRRNPQSVYKKLRSKTIYLMLFVGLVGLMLTFFRWQAIPYIGSRLMVLALWIVAIAWLVEIIWYWLFILPQQKKLQQEKENFEKYLPRHNKR